MKLFRVVVGVVGAVAVFSLGVAAGAAGLRIGWIEFWVLVGVALGVIAAFGLGLILGRRRNRQ